MRSAVTRRVTCAAPLPNVSDIGGSKCFSASPFECDAGVTSGWGFLPDEHSMTLKPEQVTVPPVDNAPAPQALMAPVGDQTSLERTSPRDGASTKLDSEIRKLRLERRKLYLEVRELKRPLWQRNLPAVVAVVSAFFTFGLSIRAAEKSGYESTQRALAEQFVATLDSKTVEDRLGAIRLLTAIDPRFVFRAIDEAYIRAMPKSSEVDPALFLRVGIMEAVSAKAKSKTSKSANGVDELFTSLGGVLETDHSLALDRVTRLSLLIRGLRDISPLVRRKAILGLASADATADVEATFRSNVVSSPVAAPPGMVYVSGVGVIGSDDRSNESPEDVVRLSPFFIDQDVVTNADWRAVMPNVDTTKDPCKDETSSVPCFETRVDAKSANVLKQRREDVATFGGEPLVGATFMQARHYCLSAGKRLPTEFEWEVAARGPLGWSFPWGESVKIAETLVDNERKVRSNDGNEGFLIQKLRLARGMPDDKNYRGIVRLASSVRHWVDSEYTEVRPSHATGVKCTNLCVIKGASGFEAIGERNKERHRLSRRQQAAKTGADDNIGFRCAKDAVLPASNALQR